MNQINSLNTDFENKFYRHAQISLNETSQYKTGKWNKEEVFFLLNRMIY